MSFAPRGKGRVDLLIPVDLDCILLDRILAEEGRCSRVEAVDRTWVDRENQRRPDGALDVLRREL